MSYPKTPKPGDIHYDENKNQYFIWNEPKRKWLPVRGLKNDKRTGN